MYNLPMVISEFYAKDRTAWRNWLKQNHDKEKAVWLVFDKGPKRTLAWEDIVQEALCFGWIDSKPGKVSETQSKIYVSHRKPKSVWSRINKAHVEKLVHSGLMTSAGQKVIDEAKANGSWDALNKSDKLEMPPDLVDLLKKNITAQNNFESFSPSSKRIILEWIYAAKTEATRRNRITQTVELAAQGLKANHYRQ